MFHDSFYSFLYITGVSAHMPGTEPGGPQKYYISVTSSSKHVHENRLTSHLLYCNMTRLRKLGCQQYISYWGRVTPPAHISAHPTLTDPFQSLPLSCIPLGCLLLLHLRIISFFTWVLHRHCLWAICCSLS